MNKTHKDQWIIDYVSSSKETPNEKVISTRAAMWYMQTKSINFIWSLIKRIITMANYKCNLCTVKVKQRNHCYNASHQHVSQQHFRLTSKCLYCSAAHITYMCGALAFWWEKNQYFLTELVIIQLKYKKREKWRFSTICVYLSVMQISA